MYAESLYGITQDISLDEQLASVSAGGTCTSMDEIYSVLCATDWSVSEISKWLPAMTVRSHTIDPSQRTNWLVGLRSAWQNHGWAFTQRDREQLLELSNRWDDWQLALSVAEAISVQRPLSETETVCCLDALWRMGETEQSLQLARRLCLSAPGSSTAVQRYNTVQGWKQWLAGHPFATLLTAEDEGIYLEPLGHHHLAAFAWQYHDPDIARLCCLPNFKDADEWCRWLDENASYGDQLTFAVLHRDWGFIGSVSLIMHAGIGFFYYWIGPDFQGNGFGPRAVELMLAMAQEACGLYVCYAKVFGYNTASRRGLEKLGFEEMAISAEPPHDDELFYRYGYPSTHEEIVRELKQLMVAMGSDIEIASFDM